RMLVGVVQPCGASGGVHYDRQADVPRRVNALFVATLRMAAESRGRCPANRCRVTANSSTTPIPLRAAATQGFHPQLTASVPIAACLPSATWLGHELSCSLRFGLMIKASEL